MHYRLRPSPQKHRKIKNALVLLACSRPNDNNDQVSFSFYGCAAVIVVDRLPDLKYPTLALFSAFSGIAIAGYGISLGVS